jgi:tight adherence protein B
MDLPDLFSSPAFIASALALLAAVSILVDLLLEDRHRVDDRLYEERKRRLHESVRQSPIFKDLKAQGDNRFDEDSTGLADRLQLLLRQSGTELTARRVLVLSAWLAAAGGFTASILAGHWGWAALGGLLGLSAPSVYVYARRKRRIEQLCEQLPETFDLMKRALQAGQTMTNAIQLVSRQCSAPIAEEFTLCCEQQNFGLPQETTLRDLARRTGVMELQMFAVALMLQRQAGGNPVELLDNLSELARKRTRLSMKVRAITSEGRMQAIVLSVLPVVSLIGIYVIDRTYAEVLLRQPRLLTALTVSVLLGVVWIRRIVNFEY